MLLVHVTLSQCKMLLVHVQCMYMSNMFYKNLKHVCGPITIYVHVLCTYMQVSPQRNLGIQFSVRVMAQ